MKATLTTKGQITIPVGIRRKLDLHPGVTLEFDEKVPYLKATRAFDAAEMRGVLGCSRRRRTGGSVKTWLNETRGIVQLPREPHDHRR